MAFSSRYALIIALASLHRGTAFNQNDNTKWTARFAELHGDLYTAPLPPALVSQCKEKGRVTLNEASARGRVFR